MTISEKEEKKKWESLTNLKSQFQCPASLIGQELYEGSIHFPPQSKIQINDRSSKQQNASTTVMERKHLSQDGSVAPFGFKC